MSRLGNAKNNSEKACLDPFEIYEELHLASESPQTSETVSAPANGSGATQSKSVAACPVEFKNTQKASQKSSFKKSFLQKSGRLALAVAAVFGAISIYQSKPWAYFVQQELVYAYFEVRAVDIAGRPIAGAIVKNSGKRVGTTDSFGEWRRYMKVPLGGAVPISVLKKSNDKLLMVTKNFAIPPYRPEKSEIELRSSVQLLPSDGSVQPVGGHTLSQRENLSDVDQPEALLSGAAQRNQQQGDRLTSQDHDSGTNSDVTAQNDSHHFRSDHESVWIEVEGGDRDVLAKEVLPALVQRSKELGLRVDRGATWTVHLKNLVNKPKRVARDGGGLILISSRNSTGTRVHSTEFLRNYQADPKMTARSILFGLMNQADKNVLILKKGQRSVAVLPKNSAKIWRLSSDKSLRLGDRTLRLSTEKYSDEKFSGFYTNTDAALACVDKSDACIAMISNFRQNPPVADWQRLRLHHPLPSKPESSVFVAGYPAAAVSNGVLEYWGKDKAKANVTVIEHGRILVRGVVLSTASAIARFEGEGVTQR